MLSPTQRKRIAKRAAQLLRKKSFQWAEGVWIRDEEHRAYVPDGDTLEQSRAWYRNVGLDNSNRECSVCLEGALLVAMIQDPQMPDALDVRDTLDEFQEDIWESAEAICSFPSGADYGHTIPDLNDAALIDYYNEVTGEDRRPEMALKILDRAGS